jgi:molecular chaperone GrpE
MPSRTLLSDFGGIRDLKNNTMFKNKKTEKEKDEKENETIAEKPKEEKSEKDGEEREKITPEQEYLEGWKRCQADFENYRKMQDKSKKQFKDFLLEDLALQILPVVDNFEMSLAHIPENQKEGAWVQGILHIQRQLETILKDNGIEEIETKEGDVFNPNIHESMYQESANSEKKSGDKISKIISKGYKIGDKVIRATKVTVE